MKSKARFTMGIGILSLAFPITSKNIFCERTHWLTLLSSTLLRRKQKAKDVIPM